LRAFQPAKQEINMAAAITAAAQAVKVKIIP
jgi:hypothetical protein